mgnify:CR=1 FL=1
MATWARKPHNHVSKNRFSKLDSTSAKELERGILQAVGSDTNLCRLQFNRTLIIHANVYDQDQGLGGRYHNTTLDTNKRIQALYYKPGTSRARIQKLDTNESAEASISEYKHKLNKVP